MTNTGRKRASRNRGPDCLCFLLLPQFPCDFAELTSAMSVIPSLGPVQESCWKVSTEHSRPGDLESLNAAPSSATLSPVLLRNGPDEGRSDDYVSSDAALSSVPLSPDLPRIATGQSTCVKRSCWLKSLFCKRLTITSLWMHPFLAHPSPQTCHATVLASRPASDGVVG